MAHRSGHLTTTRTVYKVSDFLSWQRSGTLEMSPSFQRRSMWKKPAKSYLIDTIARGLPVPVILLRERLNLATQETIREVVDGQQRLRTVLSFVSPKDVPEFDPARDGFTVMRAHNASIAGTPFSGLDADIQQDILGYEFATHVFPPTTDDRDLLQVFARLNSTGYKLNAQELRNAEFFGAFKTTVYAAAFAQLSRWRKWGLFTEDDIAWMKEVEFTSDVLINFASGVVAKRQPTIDRFYEKYDDAFPEGPELIRRFEIVMDLLDDGFGEYIPTSIYRGEVMGFTLMLAVYDLLFGLGSPLKRVAARQISRAALLKALRAAELQVTTEEAPTDVLDAIRRAPVDGARRLARHHFLVGLYEA